MSTKLTDWYLRHNITYPLLKLLAVQAYHSISEDLRERVVRALDQGKSRQEIVKLFGVSLATLKRYLKQRREAGSLKPKAIPGRPGAQSGERADWVMDNLRVHKSARVRQLLEEQGCQLLFLAAYSPDFFPIEEAFSKVKALLRRM